MGNYGRFDAFVNRFDPYGTNEEIAKRRLMQAYNQGISDDANSDSVTKRNESLRNAQYQHDLQADMSDEDEMRARGENEYERSLDKRGLLTTDIPFQQEVTYGDAPGTHPKTFQTGHIKVRGKVDPATASLMREAAAQGLIGGDSPWVNTAENRTALAQLIEGKKAEADKEQARADQMTLADKQLEAQKAMAQIPLEAEKLRMAHDDSMLDKKYALQAPDIEMARDASQFQNKRQQMLAERQDAEYLDPQQKAAQAQVHALIPAAMSGDLQAVHALKLLTAGNPKLGINPDIYAPTPDKIMAQPEIAQRLQEIDSIIQHNNWNLGPSERQVVLAKAKEAIDAAAEFGPQVQQRLKAHIEQKLSETGTLFETHGADALRASLGAL